MGASVDSAPMVSAFGFKFACAALGLALSAPLGAASPSIGMVQWAGSGAGMTPVAVAESSPADIAAGRCKWDASSDRQASAEVPVLGILASRLVGRSVDLADERCAQRALEYAPDRASVAWRNPSTGQSYSVTPLNSHRDDAGSWCRDYVTTLMTGMHAEDVRGAACRGQDGHWQGDG